MSDRVILAKVEAAIALDNSYTHTVKKLQKPGSEAIGTERAKKTHSPNVDSHAIGVPFVARRWTGTIVEARATISDISPHAFQTPDVRTRG